MATIYDKAACLTHYMAYDKSKPPSCGNCLRRTGDTCYAHSTQEPPSEAMAEHAKTPWEADGKLDIHDCDGQHMARISGLLTSRKSDTERRDRIIIAVNAHDDLVASATSVLAWWEDHKNDVCGPHGGYNKYGPGHVPAIVLAARAALAKAGKSAPCPGMSVGSTE